MRIVNAFAVAGLVIGTGCAAGAGRALAQAAENPATYRGADRAQRLIDGARKEGQVTVYSSMIVDQALRPLVDGFQAKYPFVKAQYVREDPPQQFQKLSAEARANRRVGDVVESTNLEPQMRQANLNQVFWSPEIEAYRPEHRDPANYSAPTRFSYLGACHNTNLVKPADAPKSFDEFLDPKWKSKLVWSVNTFGSLLFITGARNFMGEDKAEAYFRKLAEQNIVNEPSVNRVTVDRVMAGEYPICLDAFLHHPIISARKGAPVAPLPLDPVITVSSAVMSPVNPPHPHAAMLFIDYLLSKEGQGTLQAADYFPAHPEVKASPDLDRIVPSKIGLRENFISSARMTQMNAKSREIYERLFVK